MIKEAISKLTVFSLVNERKFHYHILSQLDSVEQSNQFFQYQNDSVFFALCIY